MNLSFVSAFVGLFGCITKTQRVAFVYREREKVREK